MDKLTRRAFLASSSLVAAAAPKKRILILGGTGFLGPATVEAARARGHELTLFNRGKTRPGLFPDIEKLQGDRDPDKGDGLKALQGRRWDAVIDNSGYFPRQVGASARLLAPGVGRYIFISSISVYADNSIENQDETAKLATTPGPAIEKITEQSFGPLKALCEKAVETALPGRSAVVRPGYIVGPDDPSGRFTYWPVRLDRGGEVLAPGAPADPVQIIDVRDLGAWLVTLIESGATGVFNAAGPRNRLAWGDLLEACRKAGSNTSSLTWVPGDWIAKQGEEIFPIWAPYRGETRGFHTWKNTRAVKAGLKFRPHPETVRDTLEWYKTQSEGGRTKLAGPEPPKEAGLIAAWRGKAAPVAKKVAFIADRASHGYAEHECNAGCLLLAKLLRDSIPGVETSVHRNGWPEAPDALKDADAVVLFTNGGRSHPAVKHLAELEPLMKKGVGLAVLHYGLDVGQGEPGNKFLEWLGGYYETNWSVNPSWTARFNEIPKHPVTRGVKPFAIFDEWYYHMRFRENMAGVTPLLSAVPPDSTRERPFGPHSGNPAVRSRKGIAEHLAWAYERPGGGRGFGFTGVHFHWVWGVDDFRKVVLNGIAWAAGIEVPAAGVESRRLTYEELLENQDKPTPAGFTAEKAAEAIRPR